MSYISATHVGDQVAVWERNEDGERVLNSYPAPYYFYVDDPEGEYRTIYGNRVSKQSFDKASTYRNARKHNQDHNIRMWESDITPDIRILSNHYYGVEAPKLHVTFLDIEVDQHHTGYDNDYVVDVKFDGGDVEKVTLKQLLIKGKDNTEVFDEEKQEWIAPLKSCYLRSKHAGIRILDMVASNPYAPINSIALYHRWKRTYVLIAVPPEAGWDEKRLRAELNTCAPDAPLPLDVRLQIHVVDTEKELLLKTLDELEDSDVLSGWNSDFFDMPYIAQRVSRVLDDQAIDLSSVETINDRGKRGLNYSMNPNQSIKMHPSRHKHLRRMDFRTHGLPQFRPVPNPTTGKLMGNTIDLIGRIRLDYMNLVKKYEPGEKPSYRLEAISKDILVNDKTKEPLLPKLEYEGSLADLYRTNFAFFCRYNIRDTEILNGFEDKLGYVELANQIVHLSTAQFTHVGGTLKLAELALINYCHHTLKRVVKNVTEPDVDRAIDGALVLYPQVGLHERIGSIDINSLYPSAIRSINISPEKIKGQFVERDRACIEIAAGSDVMLTFVPEDSYRGPSKEEVVMAAHEWRDFFIEHRMAVSGYGTVFCQKKQGFIPSLLAEWYSMRKHFQKLKGEAYAAGDLMKAGYYDRLQYVYKIKLNSLYGALTNLYFRFFDLRLGESTTGTGRMILRHQCRKTSESLDGNYNVDFPLYETIEAAMESGYTEAEAREIALSGPKFNGTHQSQSVVYGDTDSTYFKTYAKTDEEAIAIADDVAEKVNASYPEFMRNTFLCTAGYDGIIKAGREIVSDRGIFVEKKRYILHLINLDGNTVDKMKVMGLDTKKTTLPAAVSAKLNGFIERFLKGESWEDISVSIVEYKEELMAGSLEEIGLPKGVNNLEDLTMKYDQDTNARLPGHVAAAIHYNKSLEKFGDVTSPPIVSGNKLRVYYLVLQNKKLKQFKSIALPVDADFIPEWFTDNFTVDREAHILRLVERPLNNILKAINKPVPSRQSMLVDSLVEF